MIIKIKLAINIKQLVLFLFLIDFPDIDKYIISEFKLIIKLHLSIFRFEVAILVPLKYSCIHF